MKLSIPFLLITTGLISSCSTSKQIAKSARKNVLDDAALQTAHVGISIYEPATGKYLYNYQGDKYFVPASNTKLPTCYAAMKYLGDSLAGLRYGIPEENGWDNVLVVDATGDPTLLHPDYHQHPSFSFLTKQIIGEGKKPGLLIKQNHIERWGSGWSWNDYDATYMAERSSLPIFGNLMHISLLDSAHRFINDPYSTNKKIPRPFVTGVRYFDSLLNATKPLFANRLEPASPKLTLTRDIGINDFQIDYTETVFRETEVPFVTNDFSTALKILRDTLGKNFAFIDKIPNEAGKYAWRTDAGDVSFFHINKWNVIYSQPTDSLLRPMMHRSDNFFAEQSLLMVSNELLGVMNDARIVDTLLKTDFKDLPQQPRWVDGSGLSRYNLFTPQDFVAILNKMKTEFGMERIKNILPTGNDGTLRNYYRTEEGYIFGKTGTLSGVVAFSGFLYTKKNKLLIFSVLVNNHQASATQVRRAVEKFIQGLRSKY